MRVDAGSSASPLDVLILRDSRESARKCSLTPLRGKAGVTLVAYDPARRLDAGGRILLTPDGDELGPADRGRGLFLVDCSWRRVPRLLAAVDGELHPRRLPPLVSAYPRRSRIFADPARGLASIEALYAALALLGRPAPELLDGYRWAEPFLAANRALLPDSAAGLGAGDRTMTAQWTCPDCATSASSPTSTPGRRPSPNASCS